MTPKTLNALERWDLTGRLLRLAVASTRVRDAGAPINVLLVGPPGDGKTEMVRRVSGIGCVKELSDATYMGLCGFLDQVRMGGKSVLVIPDFAAVVGRRFDVARQSIALMAMMCAEGAGEVAIGKRIKNFGRAKAGIIGAITYEDLGNDYKVMNQSAFLSRCFLIEHEIGPEEKKAMRRRVKGGDRSLLAPLPFPAKLDLRTITLTPQASKAAEQWFDELLDHRQDRAAGFRSAVAFETLLKAAAWLRGPTVRQAGGEDVAYVEPLRHLWLSQFRFNPDSYK